jgi:hypothetical protein
MFFAFELQRVVSRRLLLSFETSTGHFNSLKSSCLKRCAEFPIASHLRSFAKAMHMPTLRVVERLRILLQINELQIRLSDIVPNGSASSRRSMQHRCGAFRQRGVRARNRRPKANLSGGCDSELSSLQSDRGRKPNKRPHSGGWYRRKTDRAAALRDWIRRKRNRCQASGLITA